MQNSVLRLIVSVETKRWLLSKPTILSRNSPYSVETHCTQQKPYFILCKPLLKPHCTQQKPNCTQQKTHYTQQKLTVPSRNHTLSYVNYCSNPIVLRKNLIVLSRKPPYSAETHCIHQKPTILSRNRTLCYVVPLS